jgi:hypothetical protein
VVIEVLACPFRCLNGGCTADFCRAVRGADLAARPQDPLRSALLSIACTLAGRPGARLAAQLGIRVGKDTMLPLPSRTGEGPPDLRPDSPSAGTASAL